MSGTSARGAAPPSVASRVARDAVLALMERTRDAPLAPVPADLGCRHAPYRVGTSWRATLGLVAGWGLRIPFLAWACQTGVIAWRVGGRIWEIAPSPLVWLAIGLALGVACWSAETVQALIEDRTGGLDLHDAAGVAAASVVAIPGRDGVYVGTPRATLDGNPGPAVAFTATAELVPFRRIGAVRAADGDLVVFDDRQRVLVVSRGWDADGAAMEDAAMERFRDACGRAERLTRSHVGT